jgi:hypothetical protein
MPLTLTLDMDALLPYWPAIRQGRIETAEFTRKAAG